MSYRTKAELEAELEAAHARIEELEGRPTELAAPHSDVLPGGGTYVGAHLHVRVPTGRRGHASDLPSAAVVPWGILSEIARDAEGTVWTFGEAYSFPLADGGWVDVNKIRVLEHPEPGRTVVEVLK